MKDNQMEITKYIHTLITEDGIQFTYNQEIIGNIRWEDIRNMELYNDYHVKDKKIYKKTKHLPKILQYVEDCDLGWC